MAFCHASARDQWAAAAKQRMSTAAKYPPRDSSARPVAPVDGLGIVAGVAQHVAQAFLEKVGAGGTPVAGE
jgi:hypothetical protein